MSKCVIDQTDIQSVTRLAAISDSSGGGAAVACGRLVRQLTHRQEIAIRWVVARNEWDPLIWVLPMPKSWLVKFIYRYGGRWPTRKRLAMRRAVHETGRSLVEAAMDSKPALINLHNLHGAADMSMLSHIPESIPLVWTLHDMWPLTGYCCYSYECRKYLSCCQGACPQKDQWGQLLYTSAKEGWLERDSCFKKFKSRLSFIAPSKWLSGVARERLQSAHDVHTVPNGVDLNTFMPVIDHKKIRDYLGLPVDGIILLAGAHNANNPRKGFEYFVKAVDQLRAILKERVIVLYFGTAVTVSFFHENCIYTGRIGDERLLNMYYNAADVFVHPSLADNLPNTLVEATAAGTPCVTFDVGGCPEIVRDGNTGFVARYRDVDDLANCIHKVLALPADALQKMRLACREVAVREYDVKMMTDRYLEIFRCAIERFNDISSRL